MDPLNTSTGTAVSSEAISAVLVELQTQSYLLAIIAGFLLGFYIIIFIIFVWKCFDKFFFKHLD